MRLSRMASGVSVGGVFLSFGTVAHLAARSKKSESRWIVHFDGPWPVVAIGLSGICHAPEFGPRRPSSAPGGLPGKGRSIGAKSRPLWPDWYDAPARRRVRIGLPNRCLPTGQYNEVVNSTRSGYPGAKALRWSSNL